MKAHAHTERGFDRLVNFSDAVVAIAITLLVLPLTELAGEMTGHSTPLSFWEEHSGAVWGFLISFVVLANYWLIHHRMFESIDEYDVALTWLNIGWLFSIVVLPFSTELISEVSFANGWGLVYTVNLAVISLFLALIGRHVSRNPQLQTPEFAPTHMRMRKSMAYAYFFVAVGILSLWAPQLASFSMLLLFPLGMWIGRSERGTDPASQD
ncbi:MAG: TMEM175 family protein [Candidatus Nanopelagicales bacterium]